MVTPRVPAPLPRHPLDIEAAQLETPARIADLIIEEYCQKSPEAATNLDAIRWLWQSVRNLAANGMEASHG